MSAVVFQCRYLHQFELANVCFELAFICFALIFDKKLKLAHAGKRVQTMILMMRILFYLLFTFTTVKSYLPFLSVNPLHSSSFSLYTYLVSS